MEKKRDGAERENQKPTAARRVRCIYIYIYIVCIRVCVYLYIIKTGGNA